MAQLIIAQYEEIKGARGALLAYCETMKDDDLYKPVKAFNKSSIADLLVHNANTYISWINNFGLDRNQPFYKTEEFKNLNEVRLLFEKVNGLMAEFFRKHKDNFEKPFTAMVKHRGFSMTLSPLQLYTHVITHEFHHKGQILTMSRLLGYTPADTDAIRF
ncbi:MAG TPA: DinB family protein [Mucilaginibacter sp.]|nr:DinB family protein [Mucilaginibacter sp.]